ncbi:MAG TPA: molybdopterin cofactor-binding domain-containing protein [Thermomicrobiales bacterium]|jgi:CO/xanthine dehydrogenase Mo-binding subunit|nr:molybdopterin cofactor-binding domain-containing protein [Thermomicrobiales bacterium]
MTTPTDTPIRISDEQPGDPTGIHAGAISRRGLLKTSGGIVVGFSLAAAFRRAGLLAQEPTVPPAGTPAATPSIEPGLVGTPAAQTQQDVQTRDVSGDTIDSWLSIDADGKVTIYCGKVELGTGLWTALTQIVVEELDVPVNMATLIAGDTLLTPDQGTTAGSKSIQVAGPVIQQAAAEARMILLARASERLGAPVDDLQVNDGVVTTLFDASKQISYGELATDTFGTAITGDAPLKPVDSYRVVGQSIPRIDIVEKLTGGPAYIHDLTVDGMVHARVIRPFVRTLNGIAATVESMDDSALQGMPGIIQVVVNGSFVGVVAEREEQAVRAAEALRITWSQIEQLPDINQVHALMREMPAEEVETVRTGDVEGAFATQASQVVEASYLAPFQAHASMGPSCSVADVRPDGATIWSASQGVYALPGTIGPIIGLAPEQIRVIYKEGAGCYGHNGADDVCADAAVLSKAVGRPVRLLWSRQGEFAWEPKGPAMVMDVRGGLDADGNIIGWDYTVYTPTHSTRPGRQPGNMLVGQQIDPPVEPAELGQVGGDRNGPNNYSFPNQRLTVHWIETPPLRPSALRSLGAVANGTANESFMDELATLAEADPVEFRLRHLADPRAIEVIRRAATRFGWEARPSGPEYSGVISAADGTVTGRGIGFARYESEFAYAAVAVEVTVNPADGTVRVNRVAVGHDCGLIINPDGLQNQIDGCVIQGIGRALKEEITFDASSVTSLDWSTYSIMRFADIPVIDIELVDRPDQPPLGAGEPAIVPVVAAVGNAIYDATGVRLRQYPFTPQRVLAAMQAM